jgi:hypothetical protein
MSKTFENQQVLQRRVSSLLRQHANLTSALASYIGAEWVPKTADDNKTYYYNTKTGDSRWDKPFTVDKDSIERILSILNDTVKSILVEIREYVHYVSKARANRMDEIVSLDEEQENDRKKLVEEQTRKHGVEYKSSAIRDMQTILMQWNNDLLNIMSKTSTYDKAKWIPLFATMFCSVNVQKGSIAKKLNFVTGAKDVEQQAQMACHEQLDFALRIYMQLMEKHLASVSSSSFLPPNEVYMAAQNLGTALATWATQTITDG